MPTIPSSSDATVTHVDGRQQTGPSMRPGEQMGDVQISQGQRRGTPEGGVEQWADLVDEASRAYGVPPAREDAERLLLTALDLGVTLFDTAALYGFGANETLVGRVMQPHRSRYTLASKCGMQGVDVNGDGKKVRVIDGRPENPSAKNARALAPVVRAGARTAPTDSPMFSRAT